MGASGLEGYLSCIFDWKPDSCGLVCDILCMAPNLKIAKCSETLSVVAWFGSRTLDHVTVCDLEICK